MVDIYDEKTPKGILLSGTYKDVEYYIYKNEACPCAYIVIPDYISPVKALILIERKVDNIVHGGITYMESKLPFNLVEKGMVWGWDYGHCTDQLFIYKGETTLKKWTVDEIYKECQMAIDCILKRTYVNKNFQ